jgi:hypothetical protein|tara:strand:- start:419 stop:625 length:207 start_codon:yes stop_codon:yes gene_type:complete
MKRKNNNMKNFIIKILDGDDNQVAQLGLKLKLTKKQLLKSLAMDQSSVVRQGSERLDDCFSMRVEEIA